MASPTQDPPGARILARMVEEGLITPQQREQVLIHARRGHDMTCADAVIDLSIMSEAVLLKYMANIYRTRFVSTQKLAKANVDVRSLAAVPQRVADRLAVCPILFDTATQSLSVVTDNFEEDDVAKQVQMASGVREVKVYLARRSAVRALIRKHYRGEANAFLELQTRESPADGGGHGSSNYFDGAGSMASNSAFGGPSISIPVAPPAPAPYDPYGPGSMSSDVGVGYGGSSMDLDFDMGGAGFGGNSQRAPAAQPAMGVPAQLPVSQPKAAPARSFTIEAPDIVMALKGQVQEVKEEVATQMSAVPNNNYLETLNVLVALLENSRGELRGHSAQVARLCKKVCERVGLSDEQMHGILAAAYLHDIGKASTYHLTPYNVAQYEGHRVRALKTHMTPIRIFESASLSEATIKTLTHMYERFDGTGFPGRLSGKEIPLGARVLAIVETYVDLTSHDKNPSRKVLDPKEAFDFMSQLKGAVFDPNLLDLFQLVVLGDDLKAKLLSDRATVLIVDPDPEETTVLELRLVERGFDVVIARSSTDALARIDDVKPDVVISEVALAPMDGFAFVSQLRKKGVNAPVIFLTAKGDRETVTRGFELGAKDFVLKPASADVVAAKVQQVRSAAGSETKAAPGGRGVTGTLQEMSLPDVIQILASGRKSGSLEIRADGRVGVLMFGDGMIWDATYGALGGADAVYAMLALTEGDFTLDLSQKPDKRTINESPESLLLEGMRRLDEAMNK